MITTEEFKEIYIDKYCDKCKYKKLKETKDPCDGCLDYINNAFGAEIFPTKRGEEKNRRP